MRRAGALGTVGVLAFAGVVSVVITRPRPVVVARRAMAEGALTLTGLPELGSVPLPVPFDELRLELGAGDLGVELWARPDGVYSRTTYSDALAALLFEHRRCRLDESRGSECSEVGVTSVCGFAPIEAPIAHSDAEPLRRWHFMGSRRAQLADARNEGRVEAPYGEHAAMAVDQGVLLVADDVSGHLWAHLLPVPLAGALGPGIDLGPSRAREFERCDLGTRRALYADSAEVLIGHRTRWAHYETARVGLALGPWSCLPEALHRVDVDTARGSLHVVTCRASGCVAADVPLPTELRGGSTVDAVHLGTAIATFFSDGREVRLAMLGANGFTRSEPIAWRGAISRSAAGEPSLLVHAERLYAGLVTVAGPAALVVDATGSTAWVRSSTPSRPAKFGGAGLVPLDVDVELVRSRLDAPFRLTHSDAVSGEGRACVRSSSLALDHSLRCTAPTQGPLWPMIEPGATELVGSCDVYVDGGAALLVPPDAIAHGRLATRDPSARGFDATVFGDGRVLATVDVMFGLGTVIENRDGAIAGCLLPLPPGGSRVAALFDRLRQVRFVPNQLLALSVDGASILGLDVSAPLPTSERALRSEGEECEHVAELTPVAELPEPAARLSVCPLDGALSWQATRRDGGDLATVALGVGNAAGWTVHPLAPARRGTVACLGDAVSHLSVEGDRVTALRCSATCSEETVLVPGLLPGALAIDLGDRIALVEVREDGALVGRFGPVAALAEASVVELVDAASGFVPVGTDGVDARAGIAMILGRTPSGHGVLRVGSDGRALAVAFPLGTMELGDVVAVP